MAVGPPLVAFAVATLFTFLELVTSRYPRTVFLIAKCRWLYVYAVAYGVLSGLVMFGQDYLIRQGALTLEGFGLSNAYVRALVFGVATKALLHIRLFSVGVGSLTFPFGTETLVQPFEPWLLRSIEVDHFNAGRELLEPRAAKYPNRNDVNARIRANLPARLPPEERDAFLADLDRATTVLAVMELYLGFLGLRNFNRVFPP